jgi:cell division protein FtsQ
MEMSDVLSKEKMKTSATHLGAGFARNDFTQSLPSAAKEKLAAQESPADLAKKSETFSYLERATARRETGMPGASGKALHGIGKEPGASAFRQDKSESRLEPKAKSRQKPRKMYDQKAASIAKTIASRERRHALPEKKGLSDNAKLLVAFSLLVCIGLGLYFSVPEVTRISKVTVRGMSNITEAEVINALTLSPDINLVNADIPAMESRILANPKISKVHVGRSFPDRLVIDLAERTAVACVLVAEEIGTKSIAIDEEGVAFAYMDSISSEKKLPVLSGIRFEHFAPGQQLPEYLRPLLRDIAELSKEKPSLLEAFSEIKVEKISDSEAELLLFPSGKTVPIRMPARLTRANLGSALLVLDILASRQGAEKIEEIDFRTGTIVYRTKEAQAG